MEHVDSDVVKAEELRKKLIKRFSIVSLYTGKKYVVNRKNDEVTVESINYKIYTYTKWFFIKKHKTYYHPIIVMKYKVNSMEIKSYANDEHELYAIEQFGDKHNIKFLKNMVW